MEITKYCPKCHIRKPGAEFYKAKHTTDGLAGYCKECTKKAAKAYLLLHPERAKKYRERARGKYAEKRREYRQRPEVIAKRKATEATAEYKKKAHERYLKNKEKRLAYARRYREEKIDKIREVQRNYRITHADELRQKKTIYARTSSVAKAQRARYRDRRRKNDLVFAMKERARKTIAESFLRRGYRKGSKAEEIIGCDWQTFINHLFKTWEERYGAVYSGEDYHIDHIVPLAKASSEEEIRKLCHYTNLQLLKPKDNLSKGAKINPQIGGY